MHACMPAGSSDNGSGPTTVALPPPQLLAASWGHAGKLRWRLLGLAAHVKCHRPDKQLDQLLGDLYELADPQLEVMAAQVGAWALGASLVAQPFSCLLKG
jgi:hypothetical protein